MIHLKINLLTNAAATHCHNYLATAVSQDSGLEYILFKIIHLNSLKINMKNQDLLEIKKCSLEERETLLTLEGDKEAKLGGDSRTKPKHVDCTCK